MEYALHFARQDEETLAVIAESTEDRETEVYKTFVIVAGRRPTWDNLSQAIVETASEFAFDRMLVFLGHDLMGEPRWTDNGTLVLWLGPGVYGQDKLLSHGEVWRPAFNMESVERHVRWGYPLRWLTEEDVSTPYGHDHWE